MVTHKHLDNGFTYLDIRNRQAHAKVSLQGGHVFDYQLHDTEPTLWLSQTSFFHKDRAIRGGIPICWPWFGKNKNDTSLAQHGFARTSLWKLHAIKEINADTTSITLELNDSRQTRTLWPFKFKLTLLIIISDKLSLTLTTQNIDDKPFEISEALHSYFKVKDISQVTVKGLENISYIDQLKENTISRATLPIIINEEVDRIYYDTQDSCTLNDTHRKISIDNKGSFSTVVWNPWITKAKEMRDFDDQGYKRMLCIETGNVLQNSITIKAGESHSITQIISTL